jgi:hypothetical protein
MSPQASSEVILAFGPNEGLLLAILSRRWITPAVPMHDVHTGILSFGYSDCQAVTWFLSML